MKKINVLLVLGLSLALHLDGQTQYFQFIAAAESQFDQGLFAASAKSYEKAFKEKEGTKWAYFDGACAWAKAGKDKLKAIGYLEESIKRRMYDLEKLDTEEDLSELRSEKEWAILRAQLIREKEQFERGLNKALQKELEEIYVRDQTLRKLYQVVAKELGPDTLGLQYYERLLKQEDSLCLARVIELLEHHGWLGLSEVGELGNRTIWLVVQHAPLAVQEKYFPLMKESVDQGESSGADFAYLVDRILMRKGEPQRYGSQYRYHRETRERYFYPIKDHETVNLRREEVGLMPIEQYAKLINMKYDPSVWKE